MSLPIEAPVMVTGPGLSNSGLDVISRRMPGGSSSNAGRSMGDTGDAWSGSTGNSNSDAAGKMPKASPRPASLATPPPTNPTAGRTPTSSSSSSTGNLMTIVPGSASRATTSATANGSSTVTRAATGLGGGLLVRSGSSSSSSETRFRLAAEYEAAETGSAAAGDARSLKSGGMADAKPVHDEHGLCSADGTLCSKASDQQRK
jgi:hypothetical protein